MPPAISSRNFSSPKQALRTFILLMAVAVIAAAIWTTSAAVIENIHFAQGTNEMLQIVAAAHVLADRDKNFATQPNEDLLDDLTRAGLINGMTDQKPVTSMNPWKGTIHSTSSAPSLMRIEADVPGHDCRRLALFFVKNGGDLGLNVVEARAGDGQEWQRFYAPADGINLSSSKAAEDACERASRVTLAFVFSVR